MDTKSFNAAMLHTFKKKVAKATAPTRGVTPGSEFLDYQQRLATVKKNLMYTDTAMDNAVKNWTEQMIEQRSFSERFSEGYPISGDDTDRVAKEFAEGSQNLYDHFVRTTSPESASYYKMHMELKSYIKEIGAIEAMYSPLVEAKSESDRYQNKVDTLERAKKTNDLKKSRNLAKMDSEKQKLAQLTAEVVSSQKKTYAKAPIVYKAALCAYWSANETHIRIMMKSMEKTAEFARETEIELAGLDVSQLVIVEEEDDNSSTVGTTVGSVNADIAEFASSPQVPDSPPTSPVALPTEKKSAAALGS